MSDEANPAIFPPLSYRFVQRTILRNPTLQKLDGRLRANWQTSATVRGNLYAACVGQQFCVR